MPFGNARYGANILGISNANPGVITVDSTEFITSGCQIIVASVAHTQGASVMNGYYTVGAVTPTTITVNFDTTLSGTYISGGFATLLEVVNLIQSPQSNINQPLVPWTVFNQAKGGGTVPFL